MCFSILGAISLNPIQMSGLQGSRRGLHQEILREMAVASESFGSSVTEPISFGASRFADAIPLFNGFSLRCPSGSHDSIVVLLGLTVGQQTHAPSDCPPLKKQ